MHVTRPVESLRTPEESTRRTIALVFSVLCWALLTLSVVGALYGLLIAGFIAIAHALFLAHVRGNGVRIGPTQLPALWARVVNASDQLGLEKPPEVILMQSGGILNAFATRLLGRRFVILYSELVDACVMASGAKELGSGDGRPDELDFVIAHEIGHLAAGHLSWVLLPARIVPLLGPAYSRACEYTCDRCGHSVVGDLERSSRALAVLAAGGRCARHVDLDALVAQRADSGTFWSAIYELNASHPYLPKRIAALRAYDSKEGVTPVSRNVIAYPLAPLFAAATGTAQGSFMVIVAVLGIYAAIAIPAFQRYMQRAREQQHAAVSDTTLAPIDLVAGDHFHWSMQLPGPEWQVVPAAQARAQNPLADKWITRADTDAHVLVVAEKLSTPLSLDQLEEAVFANLKKASTSFRMLKRVPFGKGRVIHVQATIGGVALEYRYGLFVTPQTAYQVLGFTSATNMSKAEPELMRAISTFTAE